MQIDQDGVIQTPFLRTAYNYDTNAASLASALSCTDPSRTKQEFKAECDINTIVERFGITGELPQGVHMPMNAEFDEIIDYHTAVNRLIEADDAFMQFPAKIRERFQNNAGNMIAWAMDPANLKEARELGLALPELQAAAPMLVKVVQEAQEGAPATK